MCTLYLLTEDKVVNLSCKYLEPVIPSCGDQVKILIGKYKKRIGTLLSIDLQNGVVKFHPDVIRLVPLKFLCKMNNSNANSDM